jgi:hypothetical protein
LRPPSLRSQLNQIRLWVRQGRTDAWIAHKLDISVEQLEQFKREHLSQPEPPPPEVVSAPAEEPDGPEADGAEELEEEEEEEAEPSVPAEPAAGAAQAAARPRRRRRGRRGGRRRAEPRPTATYEGTFDHGNEGYGLWLDPAVSESQVYADHWAGHRAVTVTVEPDAITIRRTGADSAEENGSETEQ